MVSAPSRVTYPYFYLLLLLVFVCPYEGFRVVRQVEWRASELCFVSPTPLSIISRLVIFRTNSAAVSAVRRLQRLYPHRFFRRRRRRNLGCFPSLHHHPNHNLRLIFPPSTHPIHSHRQTSYEQQ